MTADSWGHMMLLLEEHDKERAQQLAEAELIEPVVDYEENELVS